MITTTFRPRPDAMPLSQSATHLSLLTLLLSACSGDRPDPSAAAASIDATTFAPALGIDLPSMTRSPSGLYSRDLVVGDGPAVQPGQETSVRYAGWLPDGTQFDATRPSGPPFIFRPGRGEVIRGWDEGVVGMRVGGRRQLVLPPDLGYGAGGSGPIPPNAILVFVVDVIAVR